MTFLIKDIEKDGSMSNTEIINLHNKAGNKQ